MAGEADSLDFGVWIAIFIWIALIHGCLNESNKIDKLEKRVTVLEARLNQEPVNENKDQLPCNDANDVIRKHSQPR